MARLEKTVAASNTPEFESVMKKEIESLGAGHLPLQQGLSHSSVALDDNINAVILKLEQDDKAIHVRAGLFYEGIVAGCSCADDPTPVNRQPEYCEVSLRINRDSGDCTITLVQ